MSSQPIPNTLKTRFMMIAILNDEGKLAAQIESLRREFPEHVEKVREYLDLLPGQVITQLQAAYPQIADSLNSPFAEKIITRIQNHLKKEMKNNVD